MWIFAQSGTNGTIYVPIRDSNGAALTGLTYNSAGASCYYLRPLGSPTQITLATLANAQAAHSDGGFVEVDGTNLEGLYRLDLPDAMLASGENYAIVGISFTASAITIMRVLLDPEPAAIAGAVAADAGNTPSSFVTNLSSSTDDYYKDSFLLFRTGNLAGQVKQVTGYTGASATIATDAFTEAPAGDDEFVVVNR